MKKVFLAIFLLLLLPMSVKAGQADGLSGRILLDVERNGEAWYVYPKDLKRYYLGRPKDAFAVMRELGLGITEADFQKIPQAGMDIEGDKDLAKRLSGQIIIQVEKNGEAWYVNPVDLKKYYLGRPTDAFNIMRELGLGISRKNLALIHKNGYDESVDRYSSYEYRKEVETKMGNFFVDILKIDLNDPDLEIITDTATDYSCDENCLARPLSDYVFDNDGFAGINGSYFDESVSKRNYYFAPIYRTVDGVMINDDQFKYWTTGPVVAFDDNNKFYYFKDSREFPNKNGADRAGAFFDKYGVHLQALMSNKPRLVENGMNVLIDWDMDEKQKTARATRIALGYKESFGNGMLYVVISRSATLYELAETMKALGVSYALNLDGGYSTAMIYNDEYMAGPGRNVPNAIVFKKK